MKGAGVRTDMRVPEDDDDLLPLLPCRLPDLCAPVPTHSLGSGTRAGLPPAQG
jgi:hypothetical protein